MKNLKTYATTLALAGIIMMGASSAKAGIFLSDFTGGSDTQSCNGNTTGKDDTAFDSGIYMSDFTGIVMAGFTGIIMSGASDQEAGTQPCTPMDNGIVMAG